jgi:hypothetical protein
MTRVLRLLPGSLVVSLLVCAAPAAQAEPWLCTEPDGRKEFSYDAESARKLNCVDHPLSRGYVRLAPPPGVDRYASPAEFPRVSAKTQKRRDAARREILERELAEERKALVAAIKELAELKQARVASSAPAVKLYEDRIRTHQTNIANLEKELGREG